MHEKEDDERGFDGRDQKRDDGIEGTKVHESRAYRGRGEDEQNAAYEQVKSLRVTGMFLVLRHKEVLSYQFSVLS